MSVKHVTLLTGAIFFGLPTQLFFADQPDVMEILKKADAATKAVNAFSCKVEYHGEGDLAKRVAFLEGTIKARKGRKSFVLRMFGGNGARHSIRFQGSRIPPGSNVQIAFDIVTDGKNVISIDRARQLCIHGRLPIAQGLLDTVKPMFMIELLHPTPFSDEINAKTARHEGIQEIGGVPCDVIYVIYRNNSESRWYFGKEDSLPRRVDRIVKRKNEEGMVVRILSHLDVTTELTNKDFRHRCPSDYEVREYEPPPPLLKLLTVGSPAPDWTLKTPQGKSFRLSKLRGQVVLMDFGASWCVNCKLAMPGMQKIHERFKDQPVKVFGINCWERSDPTAFIASQSYTYTFLINADEVAKDYHLPGIPTYYVIDKRGRIAYAASGYIPQREQELSTVIQQQFQSADRSD